MPEARATVAGAGLAGCEAAWQLAKRGVAVTLVDMKPGRMTPAHTSPLFAELVCSNSLRGARLENAPGLLKEELRRLGSLVMEAAGHSAVPAGGALAVDREQFSGYITEKLRAHPLVEIREAELDAVPEGPCVIATGPLTAGALADAIAREAGTLHFFDAAAPIVTADSIDMGRVFRASRYGKGGDDYLNCPLTRDEYDAFIAALLGAECAPVHGFEENMLFEGCMPIESIARRGHMAAAFGPMKPVGLTDPRTGREPFAAVQLRQDDAAGSLYNIVGFQTRLRFPEQRRVFGMLPGLGNAEFARLGVMHRNTFLQSPGFLDRTFGVLDKPLRFFAGQMTGVEGYVESASSGLTAGVALAARLGGLPDPEFPADTMTGALGRYVSTPNRDFQPMNANFGLLPALDRRVKGKQQRYLALAERALQSLGHLVETRADLFGGA
ncbi:MAG TPA: methylenetetrahydrofolate--tRNA-(uracil(54)-C(5))-methyltransferase (FADH(2)-oxidizing) TrmFO [Candidatus Limnocylindria bacterium]|nr:methylenetetrahydrofolate--tRNA-(uracil(54)-C(5))-methyltransferase (FADH(2)-oxidizing) TrmFO [Candidatus Limnocylindria bacterium]